MRTILMTLALVGAAGCARSRGEPVAVPEERAAEDPKPAEKGEPFKLPADVGGRALAKVLPPAGRPGALDDPRRPAPPPAPGPKLAGLEPTLPAMPPPAPRPSAPGKAPRPHTVTEEPIDDAFDAPLVPAKPSFDPSPRAKEASESATIAPPLPALTSPPVDRVSLDDPTLDASTAAVLTRPIPERTRPLPFVRLSVPEPFEWRVPLVPLVTREPEEPATPRVPTPTKP